MRVERACRMTDQDGVERVSRKISTRNDYALPKSKKKVRTAKGILMKKLKKLMV